MKKILFVADSPEVPSGFGRASREIINSLDYRCGGKYEVVVLGINHRGDPATVPYPVFTAAAGGDAFGVGRLLWMCDLVKPDVIIIQQDGWYFPYYFKALRKKKANYEYESPDAAAIPVIGAIAVDGKNFHGEWIQDLAKAVFWTQFGESEARQGGYTGEAEIIPLGVDTGTFYPVGREGALERQKMGTLKDKFIIGNVNRNQPRKRWDLTIKYFAEWVHAFRVKDARLFLHSAPTGDVALNLESLCRYYGVLDKVVLYQPEPFYGKPDDDMRDVYNCFDVLISTTQGEGMGLPAMEAMACGVPCILPDWAAFGEWARGAAMLVPCTSTAPQSFSPSVNVIGGVADEKLFIAALDKCYREKDHREAVGSYGMARILEDRFRWETIGARWVELLDTLFAGKQSEDSGEIWQDLKTTEIEV